ncbi:peptide deformylase [Herminiimonas sp.]|uniref:peptide deformylase n=1 Tax=Herminiimonas sp. TaxID=1926289 RepID=UPI002723F7A2|nr:peptide deformylase [Herminiimonas sp.]MDO8305716.1 peptide deformylase [Herminiimonas sp.]
MAKLSILQYPDERLHTVALPVQDIDDGIRRLVADMAQTMYAADGIGLAATQVDVHLRVILVDISESRNELLVLINPEVIKMGGSEEFEEGCLSLPDIYEKVKRAAWLRIRALDLDGKPFELQADGLKAMCIQHELDHLRGMVFVEHLSQKNQLRILSALARQTTQVRGRQKIR